MQKKIYTVSFLLFFIIPNIFSQSPGGVTANLTAWIKSSSPATLISTDSLDAWIYANDITKQFVAPAVSRPLVVNAGINFLPVVNFSGNKLMDGPAGVNAPITAGNDAYCVFVVWRSTLDNSFQRVWSQRNPGSFAGDGFSLATWNDNRFGDQLEANPFDQALLNHYVAGQWNISQLNLLDQPANDFEQRDPTNINGAPLSATTIAGGSGGRSISDVSNRLGARDISINEPLTGDIAEVIVYNASITSAAVRNQIFSYLALKYGVNKAGDYVASDGITKIWDSTANQVFNNAVFGLGRDDNAGLIINKTNSIVTGSGDGTGQSGQANIILSNASNQDNAEFLLVGNDNGSLSETNSDLPSSADAGTRRLGREWKVAHTGNLGTINLDFDVNGIATTGTIGTTADFFLMVDDDGDGDFTTGHVSFFPPAGFTGQTINFTGVTLNNNVVFTLITFASTTTLPVNWKNFSAKLLPGNNVLLNWAVENNDLGKSFEIQHASDGLHFAPIGTVNNNIDVKSYSFTHNGVTAGTHYYRILQTDLDGKTIYSKVAAVSVRSTDFVVHVLSNPVQHNMAAIEIIASKFASASIEVWSAGGIKIIAKQKSINAGSNRIDLPLGNAAAGNYLLKIKTGDVTQTTQLIKL